MIIDKASEKEIDELVELRLAYLQEDLGSISEQDMQCLRVALPQYFRNHLNRDLLVYIAKEAEEGIRIVKELKDPSATHKYNAKEAIKEINKRLEKAGIHPVYRGQPIDAINNYHFQLFINHFGLKTNERYCYTHLIDQQPRYTYSIQAVDFIVDEIKKDADHILDVLKKKSSKP